MTVEPNMHPVGVARGTDAYVTARSALARIPAPRVSGKRVLLKPNAARVLHYATGAVTHPGVVAAAVDYFRELGAASVAVGESPITGVKVKDAFAACGLAELAAEKNLPLLDFDARPFRRIAVPGGRLIDQIKITPYAYEYDFIVSLPVMKTHMHTRVTLAVKNMKGLLWRKQKVAFHQLPAPPGADHSDKTLDIAIADMARVLYPHMTIVDGTVGMEGLGPTAGRPKGAGIVVAAADALAADWTACRLMGIDPEDVPHLRLTAGHRGFSPSSIRRTPAGYMKWETPFAPPPERISFQYPFIALTDVESCSACMNTLYLFLENHHAELKRRFTAKRPLRLAVGKGAEGQVAGAVYIGNCACGLPEARHSRRVPGCPPVISQIRAALDTEESL